MISKDKESMSLKIVKIQREHVYMDPITVIGNRAGPGPNRG